MVSLSDASSGGELEALRALRDDLALKLDRCDSMRDYAALSLRFMDALERISVLEGAEPKQGGSVLDELSKRRAARVARASG